jgi:uncharacterized protein YjbJ (UPF0337 family)
MDKDRVKGAVNDAAGRVKRQVGEWTGDTEAQVEGSMQQAKGKAQKAWGNVKDAARDANANATHEQQRENERQAEIEREKEKEHAHSGHNR